MNERTSNAVRLVGRYLLKPLLEFFFSLDQVERIAVRTFKSDLGISKRFSMQWPQMVSMSARTALSEPPTPPWTFRSPRLNGKCTLNSLAGCTYNTFAFKSRRKTKTVPLHLETNQWRRGQTLWKKKAKALQSDRKLNQTG